MTTEVRTKATARVVRVTAHIYVVSSQTHEDSCHTYDLDTHTCTCRAGQEGRYCWHWGAAKEADEFYACWRVCHGRDPDGCHMHNGLMVAGGLDGLRDVIG